MGRSWLFSSLGIDRILTPYRVGGLLWLAGGVLLVAAGLGVLGVIVPPELWRGLAVGGAALSLLMLAVYFHPLMLVGTAASLAVLFALLWAKWPPISLIQ